MAMPDTLDYGGGERPCRSQYTGPRTAPGAMLEHRSLLDCSKQGVGCCTCNSRTVL